MFLLRSAFWLSLAFIVMAPKGTDLGEVARNLTTDAVASGQRLVVETVATTIVDEITRSDCTTLECAGGKVALTTLARLPSPSAATSPEDLSATVPVPRPRPDTMG